MLLDRSGDEPPVDAEAHDEARKAQHEVDRLQNLDGLRRLAPVEVVDEDEDAADENVIAFGVSAVQPTLELLEVMSDVLHDAELAAVVTTGRRSSMTLSFRAW